MAADLPNTRRWERSCVDFSVKIAIYQDVEKVLIPGHVTELSEGGMSVYVGMSLKPGDLLEVEFEVPVRRTVQAVVRTRDGFTFGLEFVRPLAE
jgi:PilZ domain